MYRATQNLPPYVLDPTLSTFALAGSQELMTDHMPHQHFITNENMLQNFGFGTGSNLAAGENQGDPNGWSVLSSDPTQNEMKQIAAIILAMFDEGPAGDAGEHGHYENIMSTQFTRVGVGLIEVSNQLYLTNDFSN
jgi:uncharacterized protein YkwD